ncbi:MAG: ribulose-phosphate 3-epimerase, partial [Lachnospiraceae bacterium]|nr:ribulose-phosphate 3-epimerase [Lachnospiraceae bacterium]
HLMIEDPDRYLEDFKACGADLITVHAEAATHLHRTIGKIHDLGLKAGVALNPVTPLNVLEYVLADVDMVLLMTVNPGFGGQKFIPVSIEKIKKLKQWRDERGLTFDIEIDGGVGLGNVEETVRAGANVIVAGTAVFGGDAKKNVEEFRKIFQKIENEEF